MGREFYGKGANVLFGPAVNVARIANGGRSFEYLSGEDPFLGYSLVQPLVVGIQGQGVMANVKHYLDNNQEGFIPPNSTAQFGFGDRHSTSAEVDERTNMELYMPPFEGAVKAGVLSVMCSNNLINGQYACENNEVMNTMLRERNPFLGWVCSDYDGTRSTIAAANNGLDIAMPGPPTRPDFFGTYLTEAVANGTVAESVITQKAVRIVFSLAAIGALDVPNPNTPANDVTSTENVALSRKLAAESCTLLKNRNQLLPLQDSVTVAVIGNAAFPDKAVYGGTGSGSVVAKRCVSILDALQTKLGNASVVHARDASTAASAAAQADVAVVVLAQTSGEGKDRTTLNLAQEDLVALVAAANPKTVVVTITPGPFLTGWAASVMAIIDMGLPGEQEGIALVDVLFGDVNPAGKLPHTLPNTWNEVAMTQAQYPGTPPPNTSSSPSKVPLCGDTPSKDPGGAGCVCVPTKAVYNEALAVGYRWYDFHQVVPAFAFGHGLSYTTFAFSNLTISQRDRLVSCRITNSGNRAGAEVVQLYVRLPMSANEPFLQLRGFEKVGLKPAESRIVTFQLTDRWLSIWDAGIHAWSLVHGDVDVLVGSASNNILLTGQLTIDGVYT